MSLTRLLAANLGPEAEREAHNPELCVTHNTVTGGAVLD